MKIKIVYESKTGNTEKVADSIREALKEDNEIIFQTVDEALKNNSKEEDIDLYFLGTWTHKGDSGDLIKNFCKTLEDEKIVLFGTAGFGGSSEYFENLSNRFADALPKSNKILGYFYCQGKMPIAIRNRYESMIKEHPEDEKLEVSIENFDKAQSHPDEKDLAHAKEFAKSMVELI